MRILQVIPIVVPKLLWTGPHKVVAEICRCLVERGHDVTIFTSDMVNACTRIRNGQDGLQGVNMRRFKNMSTFLSGITNLILTPSIIFGVKSELRKFDVVHLHEYRTFQNVIVHHYAKKYGVPYVLQARGSLPRIGAWKKLKWLFDVFFGYRLLSDASKVIALTRAEAEQYRHRGVAGEKITIIPNGIDLSEYANLPLKGTFKEKFNIPEDKKIILYLGRIHRIKGIDFLVKAYAYLVKRINLNHAVLVIAGPDDGYLGEVRFLVQSLGIPNFVLFTGPLYGEEKLAAYVDSEVCVLPSRYETFPNVVLEAYACSKPVIASNVESIPDIVLHEETGLLFQAGDVKELANAIAYMLTHSEEAEKMGYKARKLVEEKFSIDKVISQLEMLYEKVLEEKQKSEEHE